MYAVYISQWQLADIACISRTNPIRREVPPIRSAAFHGGRKSRANLNKPKEDRRSFATFERDGALFIGTFAAAHGEARAESRVFPCAWAARSWVNYLDKSAWPPVCSLWRFSEAQNSAVVLNSRAKGDERAFLLSIMCHLAIYLVHKYYLYELPPIVFPLVATRVTEEGVYSFQEI